MENIWLSITKPGKMYPQLMYHTIRQMKSPKFVSVFSRKTPCLVMSDKHAFQTIKVICTSVIDIHLFGFVCNYNCNGVPEPNGEERKVTELTPYWGADEDNFDGVDIAPAEATNEADCDDEF